MAKIRKKALTKLLNSGLYQQKKPLKKNGLKYLNLKVN